MASDFEMSFKLNVVSSAIQCNMEAIKSYKAGDKIRHDGYMYNKSGFVTSLRFAYS